MCSLDSTYQPCTYQGLPLGWYLGTWIGGEFPLLPTDQVTLLAQTVGTNHMAYAKYPLSFRSLEFWWERGRGCPWDQSPIKLRGKESLVSPQADNISQVLSVCSGGIRHTLCALKSRYITLPTKISIVKAMIFLVVMYRCESWTIKKAEHWRTDAFDLWWRTDAFDLWCWRRLLRVPWTARRSNQSILKEISPGCSLEGLMLKLKLQYFGHLMGRADSLEKALMLGKTEGKRRREWQQMRWLDTWLTQWTCIWANSGR